MLRQLAEAVGYRPAAVVGRVPAWRALEWDPLRLRLEVPACVDDPLGCRCPSRYVQHPTIVVRGVALWPHVLGVVEEQQVAVLGEGEAAQVGWQGGAVDRRDEVGSSGPFDVQRERRVASAVPDDRRVCGSGIVLDLVQPQQGTGESEPLVDVGLGNSVLASLFAPDLQIVGIHIRHRRNSSWFLSARMIRCRRTGPAAGNGEDKTADWHVQTGKNPVPLLFWENV